MAAIDEEKKVIERTRTKRQTESERRRVRRRRTATGRCARADRHVGGVGRCGDGRDPGGGRPAVALVAGRAHQPPRDQAPAGRQFRAHRLVAIRDRRGGKAFAFVGGAGQGNHLGSAYSRQLLPAMRSRYAYNSLGQEKTGDFWVNGRLFGHQTCHTTEDVEHADYVLFIGCNPFQSHGIPSARDTLRDLRKNPDGFGPSDHASFFAMKRPVLHLFTDLHEDYHRSTDAAAKINVPRVEQVAAFPAASVPSAFVPEIRSTCPFWSGFAAKVTMANDCPVSQPFAVGMYSAISPDFGCRLRTISRFRTAS